jgi:hypothetical protein
MLNVPKRTTPLQMMVHFVRQHTAAPGVTVTESKELPDARPGISPREVDVVVDGSFDGGPVVTSVEVIEHCRPASITWGGTTDCQPQVPRHHPTRPGIQVRLQQERTYVDITTQLDASSFGIIVVTASNQHAPWLNFEAGALSKRFGSDAKTYVAPVLVDLESTTDVTGPVAQK